jgi:hypothetical protein
VQVVVRAAIPLAGALLLGWSAANLLFVYAADTLASIYAVCVLACGRLFSFDTDRGPAWWRRLWSGGQLALTALLPWGAICAALVVSMALTLQLAGFDWTAGLQDRNLWLAVAGQFSAAIAFVLRDYDAEMAAPDADWRIRRRFGLVFLRWVIVLLAGWSVLAVLPFYGLALVAVCTAATIALELYPDRMLRAFGSPDRVVLPPQAREAGSGPGRASGERAHRRSWRRRH